MELDLTFLERLQAQIAVLAASALLRIPTILFGLLVAVFVWWLASWVHSRVQQLFLRRDWPVEVESLVGRAIWFTIILLGGVTVLSMWGVDVAGLVAGLGVAGVAVAFASQQILQNLFASLLILLQRPFGVGDHVTINGQKGEVAEINLRATVLRTSDNEQVLIPNAKILDAVIVNLTRYAKRRASVSVSVGADADVDEVSQRLTAAVGAVPGVLDEPAPSVVVSDHSGDSFTLDVRYWIDAKHLGESRIRSDVIQATVAVVKPAVEPETPAPSV